VCIRTQSSAIDQIAVVNFLGVEEFSDACIALRLLGT
jgi:hypothetical protein